MRRWKSTATALAVAMAASTVALATPATATFIPCNETIRIGDAQASEADGEIKFPVTVSAEAGCALAGSVQYQTKGFGAGVFNAQAVDDYVPKSEQLTWQQPGGPVTIVISVNVVQNYDPEPNQSFGVLLHDATGATITDDSGTGMIIDDDPFGAMHPSADSTPECILPFTVELSDAAVVPVTVGYATADGTARAGDDYVGVRDGRLTIPTGADRATFTVQTLPNAAGEPDERFAVVLTDLTPGRIAAGRVDVVIPAGNRC